MTAQAVIPLTAPGQLERSATLAEVLRASRGTQTELEALLSREVTGLRNENRALAHKLHELTERLAVVERRHRDYVPVESGRTAVSEGTAGHYIGLMAVAAGVNEQSVRERLSQSPIFAPARDIASECRDAHCRSFGRGTGAHITACRPVLAMLAMPEPGRTAPLYIDVINGVTIE